VLYISNQSGLGHRRALSLLFFYFVLECAIRKVEVNQEGLKLNGTHQLLFIANHVNLLGEHKFCKGTRSKLISLE
jgi:1-acyl-sn-glycerol-3-phosphate acyltransferase